MTNKTIWLLAAFILIFVMLIGNKKVRVFPVLFKQLQVFRNAKTGRFSLWDFFCFILIPIGLASIITYVFKIIISENLAVTLTTVFSLVFTILFGFAAILLGKIDSTNSIERQVVSETFISIISSSLLSLIAAIISIAIMLTSNVYVSAVLSLVVFAISFITTMLMLMIIKRTFVIYCDSKTHENK